MLFNDSKAILYCAHYEGKIVGSDQQLIRQMLTTMFSSPSRVACVHEGIVTLNCQPLLAIFTQLELGSISNTETIIASTKAWAAKNTIPRKQTVHLSDVCRTKPPLQIRVYAICLCLVCYLPVSTCLIAFRFMSGPQQRHIVDEKTQ